MLVTALFFHQVSIFEAKQLDRRFTLSLLGEEGAHVYKTFEPDVGDAPACASHSTPVRSSLT